MEGKVLCSQGRGDEGREKRGSYTKRKREHLSSAGGKERKEKQQEQILGFRIKSFLFRKLYVKSQYANYE